MVPSEVGGDQRVKAKNSTDVKVQKGALLLEKLTRICSFSHQRLHSFVAMVKQNAK